MKEMKKAIAYIRVSTEEQAAQDRYGSKIQKEAIHKWADKNGYIIVKDVQEKMSGAKERPLMNEIVFGEDTTNPPIDAVIVFKNDRIARDMKLYFYYEYVLNKKGIQLLCVQDDFLNGADSSVATLYKAMMQFVAEQERKNITIRTSSGRLAKARQGGYAGGNTPFGYTAKNKKLIVDQRESKIVKLIFECKEERGMNTKEVLDHIKMVHPEMVGRNGSELSYFTVRSILANKPVYQGLYKYGNMGYIKGEHEAILPVSDQFVKEFEKFEEQVQDEKDGSFYEKQ